jgi:hypothetical protein
MRETHRVRARSWMKGKGPAGRGGEALFMPQVEDQEDTQEDAQTGAQEGTRRSGRARKPTRDRD